MYQSLKGQEYNTNHTESITEKKLEIIDDGETWRYVVILYLLYSLYFVF